MIVRTSTDLPPDVRTAMKVVMAEEPAGTQSAQALSIIAQNIDQAADCEGASCPEIEQESAKELAWVGAVSGTQFLYSPNYLQHKGIRVHGRACWGCRRRL